MATTTHVPTFGGGVHPGLETIPDLWRRLLATTMSAGPLLGRLTLGIVFFPHGAQKVLGWFGGAGFEGTIAFFQSTWGVPAPLAVLAMAAEFFAPIALMFGFMTRIAALAIAVDMAVAMFVGGHIQNGFFMNWMGNQAGEGFEFHLLAIGLALALVVLGGGRFSVDRSLQDKPY